MGCWRTRLLPSEHLVTKELSVRTSKTWIIKCPVVSTCVVRCLRENYPVWSPSLKWRVREESQHPETFGNMWYWKAILDIASYEWLDQNRDWHFQSIPNLNEAMVFCFESNVLSRRFWGPKGKLTTKSEKKSKCRDSPRTDPRRESFLFCLWPLEFSWEELAFAERAFRSSHQFEWKIKVVETKCLNSTSDP